MVWTNRWTARLAAVLLLVCGCGTAAAQDVVFSGNGAGFENEFFIPASDAEAARFLNQATFGATPQDIATVRAGGYENWIDAQFAQPATLARPFLEQFAAAENAAGRGVDQSARVHRWFDTAVRANDQLRQKLAYALSQIVVVSDQDAGLADEVMMMAEWNDLLVRNAFGNYRTLLQQATRSPMMGRYLTTLRNRKFELDPTFTTQAGTPPLFTITNYVAQNNGNQPDENYAREVMQLFSIGLLMRNLDFSPLPGPVATYNQQMITTLSRVFTGLGYACSGTRTVMGQTINRTCNCTGVQCNFTSANFFATPPRLTLNNQDDLAHPDLYEPMVCYPRYHDTGRDIDGFQLPGTNPITPPVNTTLNLGANVVPAGAPEDDKDLVIADSVAFTLGEINPGLPRDQAVNCQSGSLNDTQRQQCVAYCDASITSAVDILFLEPNTATMVARQLIQRFVTSNPTPEYIGRVAAVFDGAGGARGDLRATVRAVLLDPEARSAPLQAETGKVREPMLKLVHIWRSFGAVSADGRRWGVTNPERTYMQRPLGAPSVFNFYEPDYKQPGAIETAGLFTPELQIINENTSTLAANDLFNRICTGYSTNNNCSGAFVQPPNTGTGTNSDRGYIPAAVLDALPGDNVQLIETLNLRLMDGQMSGTIGNPQSCNGHTGMKGTLYNLLQCGLAGTLGDATANGPINARRRKILYLIHLIAISPEFAQQR